MYLLSDLFSIHQTTPAAIMMERGEVWLFSVLKTFIVSVTNGLRGSVKFLQFMLQEFNSADAMPPPPSLHKQQCRYACLFISNSLSVSVGPSRAHFPI